MKLCYSNHGWPGYSWSEHFSLAKEMGFSGVELLFQEAAKERYLTGPYAIADSQNLIRKLNQMELSVPCLSAVDFKDAASAVMLAGALQIPYVHLPAPKQEGQQEEEIIKALEKLIPIAEEEDTILLMETRGLYADTSKLSALLDRFASDWLGALWNLRGPYLKGESAEETVKNLGAYIKHVHVRDFRHGSEKHDCLIGDGELPLADMISALNSIGYSGFLSLIWPEKDNMGLNDPEIICPHYVNYMNTYLGKDKKAGRLCENKRGDGWFIWPKDKLISLTFPQVLDRLVEEFPDQYAFRYTTLDYTRTYAEFREDVDQFARSLVALGVKAGDHVAVWATNVPQWYIAFWATVKLGAVLVTMNTAYKIREAEYLLRQSDTRVLIMIDGWRDSDYIGAIKELCPELETADSNAPLHCSRLPFLRRIITVSSKQKGCLTWEEALAFGQKVPVEEVWRRAAQVHPDDVCNMQYTSGTTGFPKGVMLTHRNVVNNGKCIGDRMDLSTADRMMIQVPMFHCFGMVLAMTAAMTHSAMLSPLPYFSPKPALTCINQERITCFHGVPTMFIAMLQHKDFNSVDFSHMRTGIMAGSPCPISVMQDVQEKMNMKEITIVYGQTEASPGCTMSSTDDPIDVRVSTVGRPLPEIECKVVDPETGLEMPDGENGEFIARGYNIMKGYYKMPGATAAAIDEKGWLHTGDLACRTPEGNFRITGRLKDMIIRGGENIYPKEIEEFLYTHPKVEDVQVIGVPDPGYGEEIMACIILKKGETATEEEIKDYVRQNMAKHKIPRYISFTDSFPMNAAGKILKYKMREDAIKELNLEVKK